MPPEVKMGAWFAKVAGSRWFSRYLLVALLAFLLSFFFLDYSKLRNNIYYALFAFPVLFLAVPHVWRKIHGAGVILLLLYFFSGLLAEWLSGDPVFRLLKHQLYVLLLLSGLLVCLEERVAFRLAALFFATVCVAMACLAFYYWLQAYQPPRALPRIRLFAAAANPVHASLILMTGWMGFWLVYGLPKLLSRGRWAYLGGFCLMLGFSTLICVVFQSRSALLGMIAVLGAWLALGKERALSLLLIVALAVLMFISGAYEMLLVRGSSYRTEIWLDALQRLQHNCSWVVGCAQEGGQLYLGKFHHAHSAYISILVDTGLLGALPFAAFACTYLALGIKTRSPWFIVSLVGWAGVIASSNGLVDSPRPLWIYFWLPTLLALLDYQRRRESQEAAS